MNQPYPSEEKSAPVGVAAGQKLSFSDVPQSEHDSAAAAPDPAVPHGSRPPRPDSLWIWPTVVIALIALFGAVFGPNIALLVTGQVIAVLAYAIAARLNTPPWLGAMIALILSSAVVLVGLSQIQRPFSLTFPWGKEKAVPSPTASEAIGTTDFRSRSLTQQAVKGMDFRRVELSDVRLDGLNLRGRNFDGADASGASFRGSILEGASLRGANLRGACLRGARLLGADLTGADLSGADIAGAEVPSDAPKVASSWPHDATSSTACD